MFEIFGQMVTLFSIVVIGYIAKKINFVTKEFDTMFSKVILSIAIPGLILGSVLGAKELPPFQNILIAFGLASASYIVVLVIAYIVTFVMRISPGNRGVFKFMLCFGNVGFIGFPVLSAIFGPEVLIYAAIFNLPFNVLVFTMGIWFITQDSQEKKKSTVTWRTFLTPAILSCAAAIVFALIGVHDVPIIGDLMVTLGEMTTPGALLIIGSTLAGMPARALIGGPRLWIASLFRLLITPFCIWGIFHFFVTDPLMLSAIVVISGMPVATNGTMLCYQYGGNSNTMSQGTFVTTVLSILSIPVLVQFLSFVM